MVDPGEAVEIHKDIKSQQSLPIPWGTFQLTHEPLLEPSLLLKQVLSAKTIPERIFKPIKIGDRLVLE